MDQTKIFELLEKIYEEVRSHNRGFDRIEGKIDGIENEVKKISIKIYEEIISTSKALLDIYKYKAEQLESINDKIDRIHMVANRLSMKMAHINNRVIEISNSIKETE